MPRRGGEEVTPRNLSNWELHYKTPCLASDMNLILLKLEAGGSKDVYLTDCVTELEIMSLKQIGTYLSHYLFFFV